MKNIENKISIIVAFRNREVLRVRRFLDSLKNQTNKNFDLIFVDNGSDLKLAKKIETLVTSYSFTTYFYNDSRGKVWNKCIALNIGIKVASGNYINITDVDLIFSEQYINHLYTKLDPYTQLYTQVYMVEESFNDYDNILNIKNSNIPSQLCHTSGKGILIAPKNILLEIGGYDEYYVDWGVEDNDIYIRLLNYGLKEKWVDHDKYPVYHQWHFSNSNNFNKYPEKWLDDISFYYIKNQKTPIRINKKTQIIKTNDRTLLKSIKTNKFDFVIEVKDRGTTSSKTTCYRAVWDALNSNKITYLKLIVPKFKIPKMSFFQTFFYTITSYILKKISSPYAVVYKEEFERYKYFIAEKDIKWFFRKLVKETDLIKDYYIEHNLDSVTYYIETKNKLN